MRPPNLLQRPPAAPGAAISRRFPAAARPGSPWIRLLLLATAIAATALLRLRAGEVRLLNVSYDVTREFYQDFNRAFAEHWKQRTGDTVTISQSHGGSSKQIRSVIDGLAADVVTMNQSLDLDQLAGKAGLIPDRWSERLPHASVPTTSTILFIVRAGNPKGITNWNDLIRPGVQVILPNPKTSGNGRYSYLAAWGQALRQPGGTEARAEEFVRRLLANVPVLDSGGRGATTTFAQRGVGDVLLTFESEVQLTLREAGSNRFSVVVPPVSILAENPVVWVDKYVRLHGTENVARGYLEFLFSETGQNLAARHNFRPTDPAVLARHARQFPALELLTVEQIAGGWPEAQRRHFADGGSFDRIQRTLRHP